MIDKLLFKIADVRNDILRAKGTVTDENYSDMDYFFRANLWNVLTFIVFCFLGLIIKAPIQMLWIFFIFNILREKSGGWHSYGNLTYCLMTSTILFVSVALFAKFCVFLTPVVGAIALLSLGYIWMCSPVFDENEELYQDKSQYKVDSFILSTCAFLLGMTSPEYGISAYCAIIMVALYMTEPVKRFNLYIRSKIFRE